MYNPNMCLFTLMISIHFLFGQKRNSEITHVNFSFEETEERIRNSIDDSIKYKLAKAYLHKGKQQDDALEIANGYYLLANYCAQHTAAYADSLIAATKYIGHYKYPAQGYLIKGNLNYENANYKEALNQYLISLDYASENNNPSQYWIIKFNIGLLKNTLGERKASLKIFREYVSYLEKKKEKKNIRRYLSGLYALADAYTFTNAIDSSDIYIKKGIQIANGLKDKEMYAYLISNYGINRYYKKEYHKAIDSLEKAKSMLQEYEPDKIREAICNFYIAKSLYAQGNVNQSISLFKKVDSALHQTKDVLPELVETYDYLTKYYKSKNDLQNQILYINRLVTLDSIRDHNYKYLTHTINKKYDTRMLVKEKEKLISQLEVDKFFKTRTIIYLSICIVLASILIFYFALKSKKDKQRFHELMKIQNEKLKAAEAKKVTLIKKKKTTPSSTSSANKHLDLSEKVVTELLKKIDKFEQSGKFIKKQYTLNLLAKEIGTNSSYLSKIINTHKKTSFANYINNLRIEYAITELTTNPKMRSYKIQAIAKEFGFNTTQSFSNAFHKNTGIYPSYFIKNINNYIPDN